MEELEQQRTSEPATSEPAKVKPNMDAMKTYFERNYSVTSWAENVKSLRLSGSDYLIVETDLHSQQHGIEESRAEKICGAFMSHERSKTSEHWGLRLISVRASDGTELHECWP